MLTSGLPRLGALLVVKAVQLAWWLLVTRSA